MHTKLETNLKTNSNNNSKIAMGSQSSYNNMVNQGTSTTSITDVNTVSPCGNMIDQPTSDTVITNIHTSSITDLDTEYSTDINNASNIHVDIVTPDHDGAAISMLAASGCGLEYENDADDLVQIAAFDDSGKCTGFLSCNRFTDGESDELLFDAYVVESCRRQGIFTAMFNYLKSCIGEHTFVCAVSDALAASLKKSDIELTYVSKEFLYRIDRESSTDKLPHTRRSSNDIDTPISSNAGHTTSMAITSKIPTAKKFESYTDKSHQTYFVDKSQLDEETFCYTIYNSQSYSVTSSIESTDASIGELLLTVFGSSACISDVWIDKECRNKGAGTALVLYALKDYYNVPEYRDNSVMLHVTADNTAAVRLYEKCGFVQADCVTYYSINHMHI